jgi:hypothetical protein
MNWASNRERNMTNPTQNDEARRPVSAPSQGAANDRDEGLDPARDEGLEPADEATLESFPASDAPASWAGRDIAPQDRAPQPKT